MNKINAQRGFNLIELMLALSIVAILSSLAMLTFEEYSVRSKVKEGLDLTAPAKQAVADYYSSKSNLPITNAMAGLPNSASIVGRYTESVEIGANGTIKVTYNNSEIRLASMTIILAPTTTTGSVRWSCKTGTLVSKYRPSECR
ncbi:pilin [Methylomagnum sp.]